MIRVKLSFCFFLLFLLSTKGILAQQTMDSIKLNLETITINDGLSQGMVRSIIQDQEGFIWFATKDGLNKYDGYRMVVYRHDPNDSLSLPDNYVTQLVEDAEGNFWVGTATQGLCLFDKKNEQFKQIRIKSPDEPIHNIEQLIYKDGSLLIHSHAKCFLLNAELLHSIRSRKGNIEIIPTIDFAQLYNHQFRPQQKFKKAFIGAVSDHSFWFWEGDSIAIFKSSENLKDWTLTVRPTTYYGINEPVFSLSVNEIPKIQKCLIRANSMFINYNLRQQKIEFSKTFEQNFSIFISLSINTNCYYISNEHKNFEFNTVSNELKTVSINRQDIHLAGLSSCIDNNHTLWIGMNGQGVIKIEERKQKFHSNFQINSHLIRDVKENPTFTSNTLLLEYDPQINAMLPWKLNGYLKKKKYGITTIIQDKNSQYWFKGGILGTDTRFILSYNKQSGAMKEYHIINHYPKQFESMFCDSKNNIWMIYDHDDQHCRIRELDKTHDTILNEFVFPVKNILKEYSFVSDHWEDRHGVFWFATTQGLFSLDAAKNRWQLWKNNLHDTSSLSNDVLFSICPDPGMPDNYFWLGTNGGGLNRFEISTGKCIHYDEKNGLSNNVVYGILSDRQHNLWLSTNKGLSCFNPTLQSFFNFREKDGLVGDEFNRYEYWKSPNGDIFFGGVNGFTYFNPEEVLKGSQVASIKLTGLSVFNNPVSYQPNSALLDAPISYAKHITLTDEQNMFTIEFAYLNFASPDTKKYKYMLQGFNKDWIENGTDNSAKFTNIAPGTYTFIVTGCNSRDMKCALPASIIITILPPWWGTWWFRLLAFSVVIFSIYAFYRYRLRQALNIYKLRNSIASDLHDEIGSTLSSISMSSTIIQQTMKQQSPETEILLQQISTNTDNMMEAMSDIVWTINTKNDRFDNIVSRMRAFAYEILEPCGCVIHFYSDELLNQNKLDMLKRKNLYLLFKEAVNNVAKYSACHNVWIEIKRNENQQIILSIKDDGIGFDMQSKNETAEHVNAFGGNGMSNMNLRAQQINAELKINSSKGNGTEIVLCMHM